MSKKIAVLCEMFYQFDLQLFLAGGGERYALDFITLLKKLGYIVDIYQFSYEKQTVRYKNHRIYGLGNVKQGIDYDKCAESGVKEFHELTKDHDGVFLLSMNLSRKPATKPTLVVSHGIWWDNYDEQPSLGYNMMKMMQKWVGNATRCVSVDTNSIHAMQIINPIESKKMLYIPNYVDLNIFKPKEKDYSGKLKVLIPRRIDPARGFVVSANAARILSDKYNDIEFVFCGRGHKHEEDKLHKLIQDYPNIKHTSCELHEMHTSYYDAHISWTPTIKAEGTSLGVLESLSSGVVPIVTTIGGLTDLVQNGVNGIMVAPNSVEELVCATEYLYNNRDELNRMRNLGLEMIKSFGKDRWEAQLISVVKSLYGEP